MSETPSFNERRGAVPLKLRQGGGTRGKSNARKKLDDHNRSRRSKKLQKRGKPFQTACSLQKTDVTDL